MNKEDIISTAIHEVFLCGKEAGESYQRLYEITQQKIDAAKQGKSVIDDMAKYDGFLPHVELEKLKEENKKLGKILEENDATITELRRELQANKDADTLLCDENKRLLESLNKKDAELADLQHKYDELYAGVNPLAIIKPQGEKVPAEPSHFSEGDKVIVSGAYFGDAVPDHHGVIVEVMKHVARVLITEKDSDYEDDEYRILYEYLKKI